ncbi:helix-hairpin-helix domain-containing protein [bacterium]|nr:helix-hairpin-helix domain-containing protein [bacterium]MBU1883307.1 helix-hairpin-helix domain-containing protein [bacterium]
MNPSKVIREKVVKLTDLPNIGVSMAKDLRFIGINTPDDIQGKDPFELYKALIVKSGKRQDPCVLDVFMSITDFMNGGEPKVWWDYTQERKKRYLTGNKS